MSAATAATWVPVSRVWWVPSVRSAVVRPVVSGAQPHSAESAWGWSANSLTLPCAARITVVSAVIVPAR